MLEWPHRERSRRAKTADRLLGYVVALLYLSFCVDCVLLVASVARDPAYAPDGGISLIPILLLIAVLQAVREHLR